MDEAPDEATARLTDDVRRQRSFQRCSTAGKPRHEPQTGFGHCPLISGRSYDSPVFHSPQIVLFSRDVERSAGFYVSLGFVETFRVPVEGAPIHVDVVLDGYKLGIASVDSTRDDHGLDPATHGQRAAVVLWTDDTDRDYTMLVASGCPGLASPHPWLDRLRIAWVADPDGHPIQLVQSL
jgi:glyoxylase I family protein